MLFHIKVEDFKQFIDDMSKNNVTDNVNEKDDKKGKKHYGQ